MLLMEIFLDVPLAVLFLRAVVLSVFLLAASFRQADRRISGPIARLSKSKRMITFVLTGATAGQDTPAFIAIADAAFSLRAADFSRTHRINRPGM
jgi:hypothetical protein